MTMVNLSIFLITLLSVSISWGLDPIPMSAVKGGIIINSSPAEGIIGPISRDPEYITCQSDLKEFVENLSEKDRQEILALEDQRGSKSHKKFLIEKLKKGLKGFHSLNFKKIIYDPDFNSASILIPHKGSVSCEISIIGRLGMDQIKANPDSSKPEKNIDGFLIQRTLIGSSYDISNNELHFDPSKENAIGNQDLVRASNVERPRLSRGGLNSHTSGEVSEGASGLQ